MSPFTAVLIDYWQKLPAHPAASRRRLLEECRRRVYAGELPADALVPYALADVDDQVVFEAAAAFIHLSAVDERRRESAVEAVIEWVRRSLALNRGAVFAALLSTGDSRINDRLAAHRLTLTFDEIAIVCRRVAGDARKPTRDFLRGWLELLEGDASRPDVAAIAAALAAPAVSRKSRTGGGQTRPLRRWATV
jgi:hypothetical protein